MSEKLIQIRIGADIKRVSDDIFSKQGLTSQGAIKMFLTQVANTGKSPFDNLFSAKD